ncbi:MAG: pilus assembly protein PilM [Polyangiaceae bacterium]
MSRILGIDLGPRTVRMVIARPAHRRVTIDALIEAELPEPPPPPPPPVDESVAASDAPPEPPLRPGHADLSDAAISSLIAGLINPKLRPDAVVVNLPGDRTFFRRLELPATAQRELDSVLAFELESSIPLEIEGAVYDHRLLRTAPALPGEEPMLQVLTAIARTDHVQECIDLAKDAVHKEPDVVGAGPLTLADLVTIAPELDPSIPVSPAAAATTYCRLGPIAVLDLGEGSSDLVILDRGEPVFARTIEWGTDALPDDNRGILRELRQSLAGWRAIGGSAILAMYLTGPGATFEGAAAFLEAGLAIPVAPLGPLRVDGPGVDHAKLPAFSKAVALTVAGAGKTRAVNLRQGPLAIARSFAFLREKLPLLSGLATVILVSFGFSVVAEMRALSAERAILDQQLATTTKEVFNEETTDLDKVKQLIEKGPGSEEDPLPLVDAFDAMTQLSKAVPKEVVHDVAELDVARGHVVIQGLVPDGIDAQATADNIAAIMRENPCMKDVKVSKVTQALGEKQKYILELDLRCEDKKKKSDSAAPKKDDKEGAE